MADRLGKGEENIEAIVVAESYYATSLDYWVLAERLSIPLVFYSGTRLIENGGPVLVAKEAPNSDYYYVKIPGKKSGQVSRFRLVARAEVRGGARIELGQLGAALQAAVRGATGTSTVESYLAALHTGRVAGEARRVGKLRLSAG